MPDTITIRKGLDIPISGAAELRLTDARSITTYAVKPTDFVGLTPRLTVEEGDTVRVGDALFVDKRDERIRFTSPVGGQVKAIVRGEKRKLLEVVVEADYKSAGSAGSDCKSSPTLPMQTAEEIKAAMLQCGLWPLLRQRPFGTIAKPDDKPKAIFVSAFDSAPLAPDYDFVLQGREMFFAKGIEALTLLTDGLVHVCFRPGQNLSNVFGEGRHMGLPLRVNIHFINGPHPAGNIGTQIAHIDPINKGEVVWTMNAQDVAVLGELVATDVYRPEKVIVVAGPQTNNPHYYRIWAGACMESIVAPQVPNDNYPKMETETASTNYRVISGNVLSGTQIATKGFISAYDNMIALLPEGNQPEFMGWLMPGARKFSFSRTFLSGFMPKSTCKPFGIQPPRFERFWKYDTNLHGEERPFVVTGKFEKVFPFDIYPLQLIKACLIGDIDLMENLGIYEVEPEDFALCEFIDTSKTDIQAIIRNGLELVRKENE
jgi:Na+-transporting NADH:ubiquinone oxidoreductase subunit A